MRAKYKAIFGKTTSLSAWYTVGPQKCSSEWGKQWREIFGGTRLCRDDELEEGRGPGGKKRQVGSTGEG